MKDENPTKMQKIAVRIFIFLMLVSFLFLFGCTQTNSNPNDQNGPGFGNQRGPPDGQFRNGSFGNRSRGMGNGTFGNRNGTFGNLTEEQRQQMIAQRQQAVIKACEGKSEGDQCTIMDPRGGDRTSSCTTINGNLECNAGFGGGNSRPPNPS
jgi:hypothetical protein